MKSNYIFCISSVNYVQTEPHVPMTFTRKDESLVVKSDKEEGIAHSMARVLTAGVGPSK